MKHVRKIASKPMLEAYAKALKKNHKNVFFIKFKDEDKSDDYTYGICNLAGDVFCFHSFYIQAFCEYEPFKNEDDIMYFDYTTSLYRGVPFYPLPETKDGDELELWKYDHKDDFNMLSLDEIKELEDLGLLNKYKKNTINTPILMSEVTSETSTFTKSFRDIFNDAKDLKDSELQGSKTWKRMPHSTKNNLFKINSYSNWLRGFEGDRYEINYLKTQEKFNDEIEVDENWTFTVKDVIKNNFVDFSMDKDEYLAFGQFFINAIEEIVKKYNDSQMKYLTSKHKVYLIDNYWEEDCYLNQRKKNLDLSKYKCVTMTGYEIAEMRGHYFASEKIDPSNHSLPKNKLLNAYALVEYIDSLTDEEQMQFYNSCKGETLKQRVNKLMKKFKCKNIKELISKIQDKKWDRT